MQSLTQGQVLNNRYRIVKLIGQGGFGAVYRAWDLTLKQPVALKENLDTSPEAQRQFEREATLVAGLRHPNLPRVMDHFFLPGQGQYLVMDFVEGSSVAELLVAQGHPFSEEEALPWLQQICAALDHLHSRQPPVVHRDIKPENIIITPEGQAMLVDFGISKVYDAQLATTVGARAVTPGYSPPEQYGAGKTDARTDIYALGATLYRLLTGEEPPPSVDMIAGVAELKPPRQLNGRLSQATEQAILQAMSVNISQRFDQVTDFLDALQNTPQPVPASNRADSEPAQVLSAKAAVNTPILSKLPSWVWGISGVVLLLLVLGIGVSLGRGQNNQDNGSAVAVSSEILPETLASDAVTTPTPDIDTTIEARTVATPQTTATQQPSPTPTNTPTATPTVVTHQGAWVDRVVFVEETSVNSAITGLQLGNIDIYANLLSEPSVVQTIAANSTLAEDRSYRIYDELTFNPVGPVFGGSGKLNPFAVPRIREAMNWLIDREFIANEIYGGLAVPRWHAIHTGSIDYTELSTAARDLEAEYAYNFDRAQQVIYEEMRVLGAELVGGRWRYGGQPVEIIMLIRTEDERLKIGDYVGNQLEDIGFTVIRDYKIAAEASSIWLSANPDDGLFHIYTGGWLANQFPRDQASNFSYFYTDLGLPFPLWYAYQPAPLFYDLVLALNNNEFGTLAERHTMMTRALELALKDSARIWITDRVTTTPRRADIRVASDLYSGVAGSHFWPYTLRRDSEIGGEVTIAVPSLMSEPWNPLDGTNLLHDAMIYRGTGEFAANSDPKTGLLLAHRLERAEVTVQRGVSLRVTEDWITLDSASTITVPGDAWIDWDASRQRFVTVRERHSDGLTALTRSIVYYPDDLYETVMWHDGSPISVGDFVMVMILSFDRAQEDSQFYDTSKEAAYNSFMSTFRGVRILSQNPLVIETYTDNHQLDAELNITTWWPMYTHGMGAWHNLAIGLMAEARNEAAFTDAKANDLNVERLNYIAGPTLRIMSQRLNDAANQRYIPYRPTLSQYIPDSEAALRYSNLQTWYSNRGHFWLGTGVFYLDSVGSARGSIVLQRNPNYPDLANRWDHLLDP